MLTKYCTTHSVHPWQAGLFPPSAMGADSRVRAARYLNVTGLKLQCDMLIIEEQLLFRLPIRGLNILVSTFRSC